TAKESYDATIEMNTRAEEYARERGKGKVVFGRQAVAALPAAERRAVVARISPYLRGLLSGAAAGGGNGRVAAPRRLVLRHDDSQDILDFVGSEAAAQLCLAGPATPDHLLYTKPRPLFVDPRLPAEAGLSERVESLRTAIGRGLEKYADWCELYFSKHTTGKSPKL